MSICYNKEKNKKENEKEERKNLRFKMQQKFDLPYYTLLEEILNALTHGSGVIFAIVAIVLLIKSAPKDFTGLFCIGIYGGSIFLLYIISTLYHAFGLCKAKKVFQVLDHCSIFILIAGTYTPICFFRLGDTGTVILFFIWAAAAVGVILNAINMKKYSKLSMICYISMGWSVIFAMKPLIDCVTSYQLRLLIWGGITYTLGAVLYMIGKRVKYMHSVWHVFVLGGSVLHFMMIYDFLK